jgi:hypothetical protein
LSADPRIGWEAAIRRVHAQAAGLLHLDVVRQADLPALIGKALAGGTEAARLLVQVNGFLGQIQEAGLGRAPLCGGCSATIEDRRFTIVIASPEGADEPADGIGMTICRRCGPTPGAARAAAARGLRDIWPDARLLAVTSPGGRA